MKYIDPREKPTHDNLRVDLISGFAASLTAALLTSLVNILNQHRFILLAHVRFLILAVASYLAVALLLHKFWAGLLRRMVPTWILISVLGSILFVVVRLTPGIIKGWYDPLRMEPTLSGYLITEISAARSVIIVLSFMTLLVAGITYYVIKKLVTRQRIRTKY